MVQLIVGSRGSGKTKQMVELINTAVKTTKGNIVCIEKGMQLTYDVDHKCRLIDMQEYSLDGYDMLYGFISGILAGNYDIVEIYIDGVLKVLHRDMDSLGKLLDELQKLGGENVKFTVTVSADMDTLPDTVKKYA